MFNLRPYQREAVNAVHSEFNNGILSTLVTMATGSGKTVVFSSVAKDQYNRTNKPVLVLAHRSELIDQAHAAFRNIGLWPAVEKADSCALDKGHNVVVASVQSLSRPKRLAMYRPDYFGLIITDEAHHATASTYRRIYKHFEGVPHLGVTATPNRHDEIGLRNIFDTCAFQYPIQDGIKDGWLCDVKGRQIAVQDLNLESIKIVAGEFSQPELDELLRKESVLQAMVLPTIEYAEDRPTIVFTPGVEHAHEIAACFNRIKGVGTAVAVDGGMDADTRARKLAAFESGKSQFLVNVGICTEGYDHPPVSAIALFRPTRSLGLLAQMIGRGTRIADGKKDCLVLDFVGVGNTVRTMSLLDVLGGTVLNDAEHSRAQELQEKGMSAVEALKEAKSFVAQLDAIKAKMTALSTSNAFDILQMFAIPNCKGLYGGDLATERQILYLEGKGVKCPPGLQKGEASQLIDRFERRKAEGLATLKQLKYLKGLGHKDNFMELLPFDEASRLIGELKRY